MARIHKWDPLQYIRVFSFPGLLLKIDWQTRVSLAFITCAFLHGYTKSIYISDIKIVRELKKNIHILYGIYFHVIFVCIVLWFLHVLHLEAKHIYTGIPRQTKQKSC